MSGKRIIIHAVDRNIFFGYNVTKINRNLEENGMDKDKVRVIKISKEALFEFIYENFIAKQDEYLDVDKTEVSNYFDIDYENGHFIFCAIKLEDEDGNVLFPIYTDDDELEKLAEEEDFDIFGLVISAEDLAMLLSDIEDDDFDGVVINPFHENAVELPLEAIIELYDFEECDDPDCDDPSHNH